MDTSAQNAPMPPTPTVPEQPIAQPPGAPEFNSLAGNYGAARGFESVGPNMLGDFLLGGGFSSASLFAIEPVIVSANRTSVPLGNSTTYPAPVSSHTMKIADNESPWPRNRVYFNTNYFNHVGDNTAITREMLGFERRTSDGRASVGMRLPFYVVSPGEQTFSGGQVGTFGADPNTQTSIGDLTLLTKYAWVYDPMGGNVLSFGTLLVAPTGPATIGGVDPLFNVNGVTHSGTIQPYMAFYRSLGPSSRDGLFLQGFFSADAPFNVNDSTYLYTDLGLGYIYRRGSRNWLNAIVPTVEVHVNDPITNRQHLVTPTSRFRQATGYTNLANLSGGAFVPATVTYNDICNITTGVTAVFSQRTTLALGVATPVTGPQPFAYELQLMLNRYFGPGSWVPNVFR
jgi:hypothetical protein